MNVIRRFTFVVALFTLLASPFDGLTAVESASKLPQQYAEVVLTVEGMI